MKKYFIFTLVLFIIVMPVFSLNSPSQFWSQLVSTYSYPQISWNSNNLEKTFLENDNTKFYNSNYNDDVKGIIDESGCWLISYAMVLKNLGAQTTNTYVDLRYNLINKAKMQPDPFTVHWVNMHASGSPVPYEQNENIIIDYDGAWPTIVYHSPLANKFGYKVMQVSLEGKTINQKVFALNLYLQDHPEGIIVRMKHPNGDME